MKIGTHLVKFGVAAAVTGALLGSLSFSSAVSALTMNVAMSQVHNNVPRLMNGSRMRGHHSPTAVLGISVALSLRNSDQLDAALKGLQDPSSPYYHKYLTPKQFTALYGPTSTQVINVERFLQQHGIKVTGVAANNTRVYGSASTATLESAFGVAINDYVSAGGTGFYAASTDPNVPANISPYVKAVMGLDDAVQLQSHLVQAPNAVSSPLPSGYTPQQIASAYNWPMGANTTELTDTNLASGMTIAIATAFTYRTADVTKFWSFYGLPTRSASQLVNVPIDGTTNRLEGETTIDIERSGAMSPGSKIVVYEAVNPAFPTFDDEFIAIATDTTHNINVVSTSWGAPEAGNSVASIAAEHDDFRQLTMEHIVVLAAAGDNGAADASSANGGDNADYPAADPLVVASGGTHLVMDGNTVVSEAAWTGAGGANSIFFAEPGYQTAIPNWSTNNSNTSCSGNFTAAYSAATQTTGTPATPNLGSAGCTAASTPSRQSSDMSMDADPATGYSVYFNGRWEVIGGTSFVAPELAGLFAIMVKANGGTSQSGPGVIWCLAGKHIATPSAFNDFTDITSGANSPTLGGTFDAANAPGWDHPTGWGTPNASNFVTDAVAGCEP